MLLQYVRRGVAHVDQGAANGAGRDVGAVLATPEGGTAGAGRQGERPVDDADDLGEVDLAGGPRQRIAAAAGSDSGSKSDMR